MKQNGKKKKRRKKRQTNSRFRLRRHGKKRWKLKEKKHQRFERFSILIRAKFWTKIIPSVNTILFRFYNFSFWKTRVLHKFNKKKSTFLLQKYFFVFIKKKRRNQKHISSKPLRRYLNKRYTLFYFS